MASSAEELEELAGRERFIARVATRLAAQTGGTFQIVPSKLRDFRARDQAAIAREKQG